jgi:hypothetical protein
MDVYLIATSPGCHPFGWLGCFAMRLHVNATRRRREMRENAQLNRFAGACATGERALTSASSKSMKSEIIRALITSANTANVRLPRMREWHVCVRARDNVHDRNVAALIS